MNNPVIQVNASPVRFRGRLHRANERSAHAWRNHEANGLFRAACVVEGGACAERMASGECSCGTVRVACDCDRCA